MMIDKETVFPYSLQHMPSGQLTRFLTCYIGLPTEVSPLPTNGLHDQCRINAVGADPLITYRTVGGSHDNVWEQSPPEGVSLNFWPQLLY